MTFVYRNAILETVKMIRAGKEENAMKIHLKREGEKIRTASLELELLDAIINNKDCTEVINEMKSIDLNVFRIGRVNKWKALYNWVLFRNEKGLKIIYPDADYNEVSNKIKDLCKRIARHEI